MLSPEQINLNEIQLYLDSLNPNHEKRNKSPLINKIKNDPPANIINFNPNKTFGGNRSKPIDLQPKLDL